VTLTGRFDKVVLMHRTLPGLVLFLLLTWIPVAAGGQLPPDESWRTLETDHFRITYPAGLQDLARRAGDRAETAWAALSERFVDPPSGKVDLVVTDHADMSNGFSRVYPSRRIVVFAPPPLDGFGLPHMDEWMELVVTHELVHIFHGDYATGLGGALRKLFGRVPLLWPFFPGMASPGWTVEGVATFYESALTQAGRVRGSFHEMVLRTAVLEGRFEGIDQSSGDSPVWPGGQRYYVYGSLFLNHLLHLHGEEAMGAFVKAMAGQWIPYRLNSAAEDAFGVSFSVAWEDWRRELEVRYGALKDSLAARAPLTQGETLTEGGYYARDPEPAPDGRVLAFARLDGRSDPQVSLLDLTSGGEEKLARTNSLSTLAWTPAGQVLFTQIDYTDSYRLRQDLYVVEGDGMVTRLTEGARLDHPDVAPQGGQAVAVQEEGGSTRLVLVDLASGSVSPLGGYETQELWAYPRWSPDGRWIAASRWRAGAFYDVVLLTSSGEVVWEVTRDRAIDNAPAWSPDGRWLLWASDRSGIPNLYSVPVDPASGEPGPVRQITNVLGGASDPAVDPEGQWIYFSSYHADGWHIGRVPFQPDEWFEPFPLHPRFHGEVDPARFEARAAGVEGRYNPLTTLAPRYWAPEFRESDHVGAVQVLKPGFGLRTSGEDLVGRHAYSASLAFSGGAGTFNGGASYTFAGLASPVFGVAASQTYDADARPWRGIDREGDTISLYLVERERVVGAGTTFFRRRARTVSSLGLSASHVWEHRFFLDESLEKRPEFPHRRPDVRLAEGRATVSFANARRFPFSVSPEDGTGLFVRARVRRDLSLADSLRGAVGWDRGFRDVVGQAALYKGFRGPGFGNHVLGLRVSGGLASGPGAHAFHYEVGGATGGDLPVQFVDVGHGLLFPVRGYSTASRWGRHAWTATLEYRFPLRMINRGRGLLPWHVDWLAGTLFVDGGNAWGPELGLQGFDNPMRDPLAAVGGELVIRSLALWFQTLDLRLGAALPLVEGRGLNSYVRVGVAF
jgi:Tol biopolymer transport system component